MKNKKSSLTDIILFARTIRKYFGELHSKPLNIIFTFIL